MFDTARAFIGGLCLSFGMGLSVAVAESVDMEIAGPAGILAATLEQDGDTPSHAALILPGSGPTDRNGNGAAGLATDAYRLLALGLAQEGITTLRADKRGLGGSEGNGNDVSLAAYRSDVAALSEALQAETDLDCVWLIGHSEGGLVAMASADLPGICGLVLIATPGRPLLQIVMEQLSRVPELQSDLDTIEAALQALVAGEEPDVSAIHPGVATLFDPATRGYFAELLRTSPTSLITEIEIPILIVSASEDLQVAPSDAEALAAANPSAEMVTIEAMNHVLKSVPPGDVAANYASYADPSQPLHPDLLAPIVDFIRTSE